MTDPLAELLAIGVKDKPKPRAVAKGPVAKFKQNIAQNIARAQAFNESKSSPSEFALKRSDWFKWDKASETWYVQFGYSAINVNKGNSEKNAKHFFPAKTLKDVVKIFNLGLALVDSDEEFAKRVEEAGTRKKK